MARMFKNINTGVIVTPPNEQVAAMYASHPSWNEIIGKAKRGRQSTSANEEKPAIVDVTVSTEDTAPEEE